MRRELLALAAVYAAFGWIVTIVTLIEGPTDLWAGYGWLAAALTAEITAAVIALAAARITW